MEARWARPWFAATSAAVLAGLIIQLFVTADNTAAFGGSPVNRALNVFAYFTIQSNLLVGVATLLLAVDPHRSSN
jgi:hypothetical protein